VLKVRFITDEIFLMAMSDCEKCWETPCSCGWDYRNWTFSARVSLAAVVLGVSSDELIAAFDRSHIKLPEVHPQRETST
jgi:hypothetical protein